MGGWQLRVGRITSSVSLGEHVLELLPSGQDCIFEWSLPSVRLAVPPARPRAAMKEKVRVSMIKYTGTTGVHRSGTMAEGKAGGKSDTYLVQTAENRGWLVFV